MDTPKLTVEYDPDRMPAKPCWKEVLQSSLDGRWDADASLEAYFDRLEGGK